MCWVHLHHHIVALAYEADDVLAPNLVTSGYQLLGDCDVNDDEYWAVGHVYHEQLAMRAVSYGSLTFRHQEANLPKVAEDGA